MALIDIDLPDDPKGRAALRTDGGEFHPVGALNLVSVRFGPSAQTDQVVQETVGVLDGDTLGGEVDVRLAVGGPPVADADEAEA